MFCPYLRSRCPFFLIYFCILFGSKIIFLNFVIQHCHSWALIEHFRNEKHGNSFLCLRVFAPVVHHSSFPSKTIIAIFHFTQSTFLCVSVLYHCTIFKASFGLCWVLGCSQKDNILISFISGGVKLCRLLVWLIIKVKALAPARKHVPITWVICSHISLQFLNSLSFIICWDL